MSIAFAPDPIAAVESDTLPDIQRREGDTNDDVIIRTVRAADDGAALVWRWAQMIATIIGFGIMLGTVYTKFGAVESAIIEVKSDLRDYNLRTQSIASQTDKNTNAIAAKDKIDDAQSADLRELRTQINGLRDMQQAFAINLARSEKDK